jgi:hypothetical protein
MKRTILMSICVGAVVLGAGCGRRDASQDASQDNKKNILDLAAQPPLAGGITPVEVTGCLSASGDRFVLSRIDKDDSKTVAYQLINANNQLTSYVGREVRVTGEAQPTQKAETRAITPPQPAATSGRSGAEAKVTTVEETKVDMQKLAVSSVSPTGEACSH